MEKQGVLQFDIDGEYLTSIAREWFYVEGKGVRQVYRAVKRLHEWNR